MKKSIRKVFALLLVAVLLFSNGNLASFAAVGTGEMKVGERKSGKIALYQAGDLSAAYVEGEGLEGLSAADQAIADKIYNALMNFEKEIDFFDDKNLENNIPFNRKQDMLEIYQQVVNSHPELFYVSTALSWYTYGTEANPNEYFGGFEPQYITDNKSKLTEMKEDFDAAVEMACRGIEEGMTDLEKALYLHDYIIKWNAYDYENFTNNTVPNMSHSAYGPLVENTSVCDGYSLAYSYLLKKCGINARLVTSDSMGHAWNAIELDGSWYFVDLTNDDAVFTYADGSVGDCYDYVGHGAFLASETLWKNTEYSGGNYNGWSQTDIHCNNTQYDNAVWKSQTNEYGYCNDFWYYLDSKTYKVMKTDDPKKAGTEYFSFSELANAWPAYDDAGNLMGAWPGVHTKVSVHAPSHTLFFNIIDEIGVINLDLEPTDKDFGWYSVAEYDTKKYGPGSYYGVKVLDDFLTIGYAPSPYDWEMIDAIGYLGKLEEITFAQAEVNIYVGQSRGALIPKFNPSTYIPGTVAWASGDETIVKVNPETGEMTGLKPGTTTVSCTVDGVTGQYTVHVKDASEVKLGDINDDGKINANDALLILKQAANLITENDNYNELAADTNHDGKVNANDALLILQHAANLIDLEKK